VKGHGAGPAASPVAYPRSHTVAGHGCARIIRASETVSAQGNSPPVIAAATRACFILSLIFPWTWSYRWIAHALLIVAIP
jgi:hypothetical protein